MIASMFVVLLKETSGKSCLNYFWNAFNVLLVRFFGFRDMRNAEKDCP